MKQQRTYLTMLSSVVLLSGWWSACSSTSDSGVPADSPSDVAAAEEATEAAVGGQDGVGEGDESSFSNAADPEGESPGGEELAEAGSPNGAEEDFIKEAAGDDANANADADPTIGSADQLVDPTLSPDPAIAAESGGFDPTALADNPSEAQGGGNPLAENSAAAANGANAEANLAANEAAEDINPVGVGSDMVPPAFNGTPDQQAQTAVPSPAPSPVPAPPAERPVVAASSPAKESSDGNSSVQEIDPALAQLRWVGYRIDEKDRKLKVEVITRGQPEFEIFEETNRAQQLELVIRFYQTQLRRKIRWSINSSEFRSPVALIRMREFQDQGVVDLILTHRDAVSPELLSFNGQMQLSYLIPDRYFDQSKAEARVVKERAESLVAATALPLAPKIMIARGQTKQVGYPAPGFELPKGQASFPLRDYLRQQSPQTIDRNGLPASFDRRPQGRLKRSTWHIERFAVMAVAQDDGGSAAEETGEEEVVIEAENEGDNSSGAGESASARAVSDEEAAAAAAESEAIPVETINENSSSELPANAAAEPNAAAANANASEAPSPDPAGAAAPGSVDPIPNPSEAASALPTAESLMEEAPAAPAAAPEGDVVGQNNPGEDVQRFAGKTIFMEFYDAPLSVVLKSFSEETGNNFVYPASIGQTPVTVNFKGVPWDEALKAILETYSLGMVRIGQNVVRIDQISNLSTYLQALEQARQFETRRLPTKVLVFRLNNAKAKDVGDRLNALLGRDIQLDARIRISNDDRTNSLVIEAPTHVLAKAKNIIERLDLETPQVEIASRIVEVKKTENNFFGISWLNNFNFDPGRALGFGTLNFPNSVGSSFAVDPGVSTQAVSGQGRFRFGSLNKFVDLDLLLKMEETKGSTNVLQSNRILVLDGQKASILSGSSQYFRPAGGNVISPPGGAGGGGGGGGGGEAAGLAEVSFNLSLEVTPQVTTLGSVIMNLNIKSDTPNTAAGEALANKNTRELETQMVRGNGDTGVIGGIYDTSRTTSVKGIPFLSSIPIIGALFRSTVYQEAQTELLIMVTPTIISGLSKEAEGAVEAAASALAPQPPQALKPIKTEKIKL